MQDNNGMIQAVAKLHNCHISARKMRLSADLVRGLPVSKALGVVTFTRKDGARYDGKEVQEYQSQAWR